ncbi:MAG: nucleoside triphosphate pyrophosphohydrolase [Planctomycetota bacterium]
MNKSDPRLDGLQKLLAIVDRLRAPDGCPWDRAQSLESMGPHLLEESYEVVEALGSQDDRSLVAEIGDLLMNVFLLGRIGEDEGRFSIGDISERVSEKLVRRHPHVFGDRVPARDAKEALQNWEEIKRGERAASQADESILSGIPKSLPALLQATRIGEKAARVGFEWPDLTGPMDKLDEELAELRHEIDRGESDASRVSAELGDLLFAAVNVARKLGVDPELALRATVGRFQDRFRHIEKRLGPRLAEASLEEMEQLWEEAKEG